MDREAQQQITNTIPSLQKQEDNIVPTRQNKNGISLIPIEVDKSIEQYESQFLQIDAQMMHKLQKIEQSKNKPLQHSNKSNQPSFPPIKSQQDQKQQQAMIKRQFVHKLKQWQRQRQELKIRKQQIEQRKQRQKQQEKQRKQRQAQQEKQFLKLQKQKQIQQKIQQIEQRRQQREQSLKNALLKRSYNNLPSYSQQQQRYRQEDQEQIQINIKLLKNKRNSKIDPEELKLHQMAYIQRIKERLNMVPKRQEKAKSDFNLYLKRNQEKKEQQMKKIQKMKKYQQNINKIPIKISEYKKQQKLIQIDKIKNPQKYRLLSNKLLNDKQIFQQFKNFQVNINRKEIGMNYLKQLKQMHSKEQKVRVSKRSNSQIISNNYQQRLPSIHKKYEQQIPLKQPAQTKSVELKHSQTYKVTLEKNRERDSKYMKALRQKLAQAIDI